MLIATVTAGAAVFVALLVSTLNYAIALRQTTQNQLVVLADVIARNSASAIIFDDAKAANETLSALQANKNILYAEILNINHQKMATYVKLGTKSSQLEQSTQSSSFTYRVVHLYVERNITMGKDNLGKLRVTVDLSDMWLDMVRKLFINLAGFFLSLIVSYLALRRLSKYILQPIECLVKATRDIIKHNEYSLRVEKTSQDELGELTDEFNKMLAQIEIRDNQLRQSSEALAQTQEPIMLRDDQLRCQYVNPAFTALFGYSLHELIGKKFSLHVQTQDLSKQSKQDLMQAQINDYAIARTKGVFRGESNRQTKSGDILPIAIQISPIRDGNDHLTGYVSVLTDMTEKKKVEQIIWQQANFDALTRLPNRHMFHDRLEREIKKANRTNTRVALIFLDLDHFKEINDTLGHDMGDVLLKEVACRLVGCIRQTDTVSRLGGDEFTIILGDLVANEVVEHIMQDILLKLAEPFTLGVEIMHISASIGVTLYPEDGTEAEVLLKNADQAMYIAKNSGRNRFSYFTKSIQEAAQNRRQIVKDLREAIIAKQFRLFYQPIVELTTGAIHKGEALIRWQHPARGVVSPADFIPVAEETGMIVEMGDWVFREAALQVANWRKFIDPEFQLSINKSPVQFQSGSIPHTDWFEFLDNLKLTGDSIVIEITEGLLLDANPLVSEKLLAFRDAGIQVSLDDFGTGYSSLSYLKKFDIDYIKIDQSFTRNLQPNSDDMALCEAIIVMAHKLGIKVIAEGIETSEQRDLLTAAHCDYGQGYFYSRPIPATEFEELLKTNVITAQPEYLFA